MSRENAEVENAPGYLSLVGHHTTVEAAREWTPEQQEEFLEWDALKNLAESNGDELPPMPAFMMRQESAPSQEILSQTLIENQPTKETK